MKLKKLELTAVEFFEMLIAGKTIHLDCLGHKKPWLTPIGNWIVGTPSGNEELGNLNKPRTVWIEQQWYEDIPEQGVLCWTDPKKMHACIITKYIPHAGYQFKCTEFNGYANPIPLAPEEITRFLPAEPVTKYDKSNWAENPSVEFPIECYVSDSDPQCEMDSDRSTVIIVDYARDHPIPFIDNYGVSWKYAIPVDE